MGVDLFKHGPHGLYGLAAEGAAPPRSDERLGANAWMCSSAHRGPQDISEDSSDIPQWKGRSCIGSQEGRRMGRKGRIDTTLLRSALCPRGIVSCSYGLRGQQIL